MTWPYWSTARYTYVREPAVTDAVPARPRSLDDERGEALHPPVDGDVIDLDAAFGQQLFDIAVRQAVAQVPTHSQQDRIGPKPAPRKRNGLNRNPPILKELMVNLDQRCRDSDPLRAAT